MPLFSAEGAISATQWLQSSSSCIFFADSLADARKVRFSCRSTPHAKVLVFTFYFSEKASSLRVTRKCVIKSNERFGWRHGALKFARPFLGRYALVALNSICLFGLLA